MLLHYGCQNFRSCGYSAFPKFKILNKHVFLWYQSCDKQYTFDWVQCLIARLDLLITFICTCITGFYSEQWTAEFLLYGAGKIEKVFDKAGNRGDWSISLSHWQAQSSKGLHEALTTPDCSYVSCMSCGKMYVLCHYNCIWWIRLMFLLTNIK